MKYKDWSDFKLICSGINDVMSKPKGCKDLTERQRGTLASLLTKQELTDKDKETLEVLTKKMQRWEDPELSATAIRMLLKKYAHEKYGKRVAAMQPARGQISKGTELEEEGVNILREFDKIDYHRPKEHAENDFLLGRCDIYCNDHRKVVDIKTAWSINTFLPNHIRGLDRKYWWQMQGYLELYDLDYGEVCFVLLNTPQHLIDRAVAKLMERYVFGEVTREKYDEDMETLETAYTYDKIPIRRRIIRFEVQRTPEVVSKVRRRVERCREWLSEFERKHLLNEKIITSYEDYTTNATEENNPEHNTGEPLSSDEG